ncbi:MAG: ABC transporter substrate-binding protein [Syntrophomonadaceae bacterium]|jgi:branched-chain amino acid transport system substrate-binding protein|nr:ABC transporter substrate-binding protein [Bacillota bacterium]HAA10117.1 ethanolamine utilization protein EutJ [Syntrophomonas sp.]
MRIRRKVSMLVLMLFMLSIVAGCSQGGDNGAAQQEGDTIKVGINTELSGPVASYGSNAANGALLAIEEINAAGGVLGKQLDPLSRDCKSIPDEAMSVSAALVGEKIVAQIGPLTSGNVAGSTPVMMENQIPLLAPAATAVNVTVDEKTNKVRDFIFRVCYRDSDQGQRMANFALEDLNVKNAAIYGSTSDDYATGLAKYFKEEFTSKGGTIVAEEGFVNGDKDFRATLTKIKSADPEFIYVPGYYTEVAVLIKQAREMGITCPIGGGDGWDSPDMVSVAGAEALNNTYFTNHYSVEDPDPAIQSFVEAYKAKYNKLPDSFAALGYDAARLLADAIERAGEADPVKVKEALEATKDFPGITGTMSIDENHNPVKNIVVIEYKDGNLISR